MKKKVFKYAIGLFIICAIGFNSIISFGSSITSSPEAERYILETTSECDDHSFLWCETECVICPYVVLSEFCVCNEEDVHDCLQCLWPTE